MYIVSDDNILSALIPRQVVKRLQMLEIANLVKPPTREQPPNKGQKVPKCHLYGGSTVVVLAFTPIELCTLMLSL